VSFLLFFDPSVFARSLSGLMRERMSPITFCLVHIPLNVAYQLHCDLFDDEDEIAYFAVL